jgi:iron only hydrogenase large subunit-like protein
LLSTLRRREKKLYVAQIDASVGPALSEAFGLPPGTVSTGRAIAALKAVGFDLVFATAAANGAVAAAAASELISSQKVYFTSTCPAFVNYVERTRPDLIPQLSTVRSPSSVLSGVVKTALAKSKGLSAADVYVAAVGGCLARKEEVARTQLAGLTDVALTVRELVALIRFSGVNFHGLKDAPFDAPYSGGGQAFAVSGGVLAAVLGKAGVKGAAVEKLGGSAAQKAVSVTIGGKAGKAVAVQGLAEGVKLLDKLKKGDPAVADVRVVEVLACPGGCVAGGGSVKPKSKEAFLDRVAAIGKVAAAGEDGAIDAGQELLKTSFAKAVRK